MIEVLALVAAVVGVLIVGAILDVVFRCPCAARRPWYYDARHEAGWLMAVRTALIIGCLVAIVVGGWDGVGTAAWLAWLIPMSVWMVRRTWFHHKDGPRRRRGRAAGRVRVNAHGRLEVAPA